MHTTAQRLLALSSATLTSAAILVAGCTPTTRNTTPGSTRTIAAPRAELPEHVRHPTKQPNWWSEARFGMFIHWGLYAIPAGAWNGRTDYGEWIRDSAQIPLGEYNAFQDRFNPAHFDADAIVLAAKNAGMKYIVITTKHHDGFGLFDSKLTDWDVMSTPFRRDIMKELSAACQRHGIRMCWYYSIMDWHHPDYTPRRPWERAARPDNGDMDRYVAYMKGQLKELLTNYGPIGVLWFDGQWEGSWNDTRGRDLEHFVRSLQPGIIINSRVGRGGGTWGLDGEGGMLGDYATPEQTIPESAIRDVPWETCMTMNGHWGFNAADKSFKSSTDLIRKLADIASKGGNFLLNVGPTADGEIPAESLQRLGEIGAWMQVHGDSIYGTTAGPYDKPLDWGCITQKSAGAQATRLYLHVFHWPASGELILPGMLNTTAAARLMVAPGQPADELPVRASGDDLIVSLPAGPTNPHDTVIILDLPEAPDVSVPPAITADAEIFVDQLHVHTSSPRPGVTIRYTTDGADPTPQSPAAGPQGISISKTTTINARAFRGTRAVSPIAARTFTKVTAESPAVEGLSFGLRYAYYEGALKSVQELDALQPVSTGTTPNFVIPDHPGEDNWCFKFNGYVRVPAAGVYTFYTRSDDGSSLSINGKVVVANDGPHSATERSGVVALAPGWHAIEVRFFENTGGHELVVSWSGPGIDKQVIPARVLAHKP